MEAWKMLLSLNSEMITLRQNDSLKNLLEGKYNRGLKL